MTALDTASLVFYPSGYKESELYSIKPTNGTGDLTFTRASSATRVNAQGLIEGVATNVPRIDFTGGGCGSLLLEPQRTNLIPYSENFNNWSKSGWTLTSGVLGPNGDLDAFSVLRTTGTSFAQTLSLLSNTTYTFSAYIKNVNATNIQLRVQNQAGNTSGTESNCVVFSVTAQTNTSDFTRISHTFNTGDAGAYGIFLGYYSAGEYIVYGAQAEQGSYATSYIPTSGTTVTRIADESSTTGLSSVIGQNEGVFYAEIKANETSSTASQRTISLSDETNSNRLYISFDTSFNKLNIYIIVGGTVVTFEELIVIPNQNVFNKVAIKYKSGDSSIYVNGVLKLSFNDTFSGGSFDTLNFGNRSNINQFYGESQGIIIFPTALTDEQLTDLTGTVHTTFNSLALSLGYTIL
jgi:hypothetical protein